MDLMQYNLERYKRKKSWLRIRLGITQFIRIPALNLLWGLIVAEVMLLVKAGELFTRCMDIPEILTIIVIFCVRFLIVIIPSLSVIGMIQLVAEVTARDDEGNVLNAFKEIKDIEKFTPVLMSKKTLKGSGVTIREFYSPTIPMECWKKYIKMLCGNMSIHLVGDMEYGGKNCGNRIVLKSKEGMVPEDRGAIYDEEL